MRRHSRPGQRYLDAGAEEARRRGHGYIGTEHVLLALARDPASGATRVLRRFGVTHRDLVASSVLSDLWGGDREHMDPGTVRIECIMPRLKQALAEAVERAAGQQLRDEHVLLAMLGVRDSIAARTLNELGVSLEAAEAAVQAPNGD